MNKFFLGLAQAICTASILANVAFLFKVSERLAKLETTISDHISNTSQRNIAKQ